MRLHTRTLSWCLALACAGMACACAPTTAQGVSEPAPPPVDEMQRPAPPDPRLAPATCDADAAKTDALGKKADDAVLERARQAAGAGTARFLRPGQGITKEFRADRLNLHLDADDVVVQVNCG